MSVAGMTVPQLKHELEVASYEMWGGYSKVGIKALPFLGREPWCRALETEIERREWREKYPEHAKLEAIPLDQRDAIGGFIEWIYELGLHICRIDTSHGHYTPMNIGGAEGWVAFYYFGIDPEVLSKEKGEMHQEIRQGG